MPPDEQHMRRAIDLAMRGRGRVGPNPMVGCVIVKNDRVIGEGYHQGFGEPHAEPNALAACTESPKGATAYVTLEPCCHVNKKTPPCVPRLIEAKLSRVVLGATDPNPEVSGKGISQLRAAGVDVITSVLEAECQQLAAPFIARMMHQRPYVTLKWTQTADVKVAGPGGARTQISNPTSSAAVHRLRAACDSILVSVNTVLTDDPRLTARGPGVYRQPARFVIDRDLRMPLEATMLHDDQRRPTIFSSFSRDPTYRHKRDALLDVGAQITVVNTGPDGHVLLADVLARIIGAFCYDLLVEPGPTLAHAFFSANLVDRLWVIESRTRIADLTAPTAASIPPCFIPTGRLTFDGDTLTEYLNPKSPVFFAAVASADFTLESESNRSTADPRQ